MSPTGPGGFKTEEAARYDDVAGGVANFSHLVLPLARRILVVGKTKPTDHVLDVGTGSGIIANLAAHQSNGGRVVGVDFSEGMLKEARVIASKEGLDGKVEYEQGDAQNLQYEPESFDVITCLFTFMHLDKPLKTLQDMLRILRPGGRVVVGVGSRPPLESFRGWMSRTGKLMDVIGRARGKVLIAPDHLNGLVQKHLSGQKEAGVVPELWRDALRNLPALMREAGFQDVGRDWEGCRARCRTAEEFWQLQNTFSSFSRQRIIEAPPEKVEALRKDFFDSAEAVLARQGRLVYHYAALFVVGHKA